jgi:arsenate reductase
MAEGFLKSIDNNMEVFSAGTKAEQKVNPYAVKAMAEIGIDISNHYPKQVDIFIKETFDYVITVCDGAKEVCPIFTGKVTHRLHIGFDDPSASKGTEEEIMNVYRRVRDEIKKHFQQFYIENIQTEK